MKIPKLTYKVIAGAGLQITGGLEDIAGGEDLTGRTITLSLREFPTQSPLLLISNVSTTLLNSTIIVDNPASGTFEIVIDSDDLLPFVGKKISGFVFIDWVLGTATVPEAAVEIEIHIVRTQ